MSTMNFINDFIKHLEASLPLDERLIIKRQDRYFLMNAPLRMHIHKDFFYAGAYLGKVKDKIFFPSFILLAMMAEGKANKIIVDKKAAWLFICGRDVFKRGILNVMGSKRKGSYTLVLNQQGECLGFGRTRRNITGEIGRSQVIIRNISNIGDFLKREQRLT